MKKKAFLVLIGLGIYATFFTRCASPGSQQLTALDSLKTHIAQFDTATDEDIAYIHERIKPGIPYELNLADDKQYRYIVSGFLKAGETPEKSPELFQNLKMLREKIKRPGHPRLAAVVASPQARKSEDFMAFGDAESLTLNDSINPAMNLNMLQFLRESYNGSNKYLIGGLSSLINAVPSTAMYFTMYTGTNTTPFYNSPTYKAYGAQTNNFQTKDSANVPSNQVGQTVIGYVTIAVSNAWPVLMKAADNLNATDQCVTAPNYQLHQVGVTTCPAQGSTCINKGNISAKIVSCYARNDDQGNCGSCNYGWPNSGAYPPNFNMVISGSITFPYPLVKSNTNGPVGQFMMYLQNATGGGCMLNYQDSVGWMSLPAQFTISGASGNILNYCFTSAAFRNNGCLTTPSGTAYLNLNVAAQVVEQNGTIALAQASVSSNTCTGVGQPWCAAMPMICVTQGCLKEGTKIMMDHGIEMPIQDARLKQLVVSNNQSYREISNMNVGIEGPAMYVIATANGKSVSMTGKHAVPTRRGIKLAADLKVGDVVSTISGDSKIVTIAREKWNGKVYNIYAGTESDAIHGKSTFYANGILVGDMGMQQYYASLTPATDINSVYNSLPESWKRDMKNYYKGAIK